MQGQDIDWRQSYFREEQTALSLMDDFPKRVARVVKSIRDKDENLSSLNSYLIKTTLLNLITKSDEFLTYIQNRNLNSSVLHFLHELWANLTLRNIHHHFVPMHNLLIKHSKSQIMPETEKLSNRLKQIITDKEEFMKILIM